MPKDTSFSAIRYRAWRKAHETWHNLAMSTARTLAWNTGIQIAGKVVSTFIGVLVVGLMTRHLGQVGFGMYTTANAYFQVFAILLDLGLNVMLVQVLGERAGDRAFEDRAVSATFTLRMVTSACVLAIATVIGFALPYPAELRLAFVVIVPSFFFALLNQIVIGVHQRHLNMRVVAIGEIIGRLMLLGGVLFARAAGLGLLPIVAFVSLGSIANYLVISTVANRFAAVRWNWDPAFWRIILERSWPIGVSILFNLIYFKADTLILSFVRPFAEVGVYGAAYRVLEILITVPFMYTGVLLPLLANAWAAKQPDRFRKLFSGSLVAMLALSAPLIGGVLILGERLMGLVAGSEFSTSGAVLKILMLAVVLIFVGTISSHVIVALNAQRRMLPVYIVIALITLVGYVLFIPTYGMWAAAWLTVFSEGCVAITSTVISLRASDTPISLLPYAKIALAVVFMSIVIFPLRHAPLAVPIVVGAAAYAIAAVALGTIPRDVLRDILTPNRKSPATDLP